jgi:hypothetical protein
MATATATSRLEQDRQRLEASYKAPSSKQMRAEPHPTYVSAAWAKMNPEYGAQAVSGFQTFLDIIDAEVSNTKDWRIEVDPKASAYVKGVAKALNAAGSTWDHATQGGWMATDAAFNFASFLIDANNKDKELIQAMMDLFGTATTVITAPVKATLAVGAVNMYPGMRIEFNYAAPQKAANNIVRSNDNSEQGLTNEEQSLIDATNQTTPNLKKDEPGVVGDFTATPGYNEIAQNER